MSARETALSALHDALKTISGPVVLRSAALPQSVPNGGVVILRDGDPGEPEVTLSPLSYYYEHQAEIEVVVATTDNDTSFDSLAGKIGVKLLADRTLGGAVEWVEADAPAPQDLPGESGEVIKAAIINVTLVYATSDPLN